MARANVKFKPNMPGYLEVMNYPEVQGILHDYAVGVQQRAEAAHGWDKYANIPYEVYDDTADHGKLAGRPVVHVATHNPASTYGERKNHTLKKAL